MESDDLLDFIPLEGLVDHNFPRLLVHSILNALQRRNIRTFRFLDNVLVLHDNSRNGIITNPGSLVDTPPAESQQFELEKLRNLITHDFDGHCATQIFQPQSKKEFEDYVKSAVFSLDSSIYVLLREISLKTLGSNMTEGHGSNHDSDKLDFNWSTVFLRGDDDSCRQEQFNRLCSFFKAVKSESEPEYHAPYNADNNDLMTTAKTVIAQMDIEDLCHKIYFVLQLLTNYRRTTAQGKSTIVSGAINRFDFSLNEAMTIYDCQVKSELVDLFNHFDLNTRKEPESAFGTTYNNMIDSETYPIAGNNSGDYYGIEPGSPSQPAASRSVVFSEFNIFYALVRELSSIHIKFAQDFGLFSNSEFSFDILRARHFGDSNESQMGVSGNDDGNIDNIVRPESVLGKFLENLQYMLLNENEIRSVIMVLSSILHLTNLDVEFVTAFEFQKMTGKIEVNDNEYSGYNAYYKNKMKALQKNRSSTSNNNNARFDYNSYLRSSNNNNGSNSSNNSETMGFDNTVKNIPLVASKTFSLKQIAVNLGVSEDSLYAHLIFGDSQSTANIGTANNVNGNNQKKSNADVFDFSQFFQDQDLFGSPDLAKKRSKWGSQTSVDISNAKAKEEIFLNISNLCRALYQRVFSFIIQKMNELFECRFSFKYLNPNYGNGMITKPKLSQCLTVFDVCGSRDFFAHNKNVSTNTSITRLGYNNASTFANENTLSELFVNYYNEKLNFHSLLQKDELFVASSEQEYISYSEELNHFQYLDSLANIDNLFRTIENASNLSSMSRDISNSFMFVYLENNIRMANNQHYSQYYESQFSHVTHTSPADETSSQAGFKGKNGVFRNANTIRLFDNNHFVVSHFSNQIVYCSKDVVSDNNAINQVMGQSANSQIDILFSNCFEPNLKTLIQSTSAIRGEENMVVENNTDIKKTYLSQGRALLSEFLKENDELLDDMEVHSVLNVNLFDTDEVAGPIDLLASQSTINLFNKNKSKKLLANDYLMKQLNNFQIIAKLKSFHLKSFPYKFFLRDLHAKLKPFLMDFGIDFANFDENNNQIQLSDEMVHAQTSFVISRIVSDFNEELRQSQMHMIEAQNKIVETKDNEPISSIDNNNNNNNKFDDKAKYNRSNSNGMTNRKREMSQSSLTTITNSNANNSAENQFEGSQGGRLVEGRQESNQSMDEGNNGGQDKNEVAQVDEQAISYKPLEYKISKHLIHCNFDLLSILISAEEILHNRLATKIQSRFRAHAKCVDFNRLKQAVIRVQSNFRRRMWFRLYKSVMNLDVELSKNESHDNGNSSSYVRELMKDRQYPTIESQQHHDDQNTAPADTSDSGQAYLDMHRKYSSVMILRRSIPRLLRELSFRHELLTLHALVADGNIEDIQKFYCDIGPGGFTGDSIASRTVGSNDVGRTDTDDQSAALNTVRSDRELPYYFDNPYINGIKRVRNSRDFMRNTFHVAAINSQAEVFVRLRPNVDDILCKDSSGNIPLHLTYLNPRTDMVRQMFNSLQSTCPPIFRILTDPDYYGYCGKEGDSNILNTGKVKSRTVDYFKHHLHAVVANTVMSSHASALSNTTFDTSIIRTDMVYKLNRFKQFQKRLFVLSKSTNIPSRGNSSVEGPNILSCTLRYYKPSVNMALNYFEDEFQLNTFNCELFGIELDHNALNFGKGYIIIIRMRNDDNKNNDVSDIMHEIYLEAGFYENATKTSTYNFKSTNGRNQIIFACETREGFQTWLRNLCDHGLQLTHLTPAIIHQGIFRPQIHSVHEYDDKQVALQRGRREDTIDYSSVPMTDFYAMKLFFSTPNNGGRTLLHLLAFCETFVSERPDDIFLDEFLDTTPHVIGGNENEEANAGEANEEYDMDEIINIIESENANMVRNNGTSPTRKKQQYSQEIFVHNPDDESHLSPTNNNNNITKFPYVRNDFFNSIDFDLAQVTAMISCACYLIENGCGMDNYDLERKTALDYALTEGNFFLVALLLLRGCDTVNITGNNPSLFSSAGKKASFIKSIRKSQAASRYDELLAAYKKPKLQHYLKFRPTEEKVPGGTYFSLYLGRIVLTSSSMMSFTSLQCPFIRIRVLSLDQVVIDEVISPYPCAFHGADLLLIGLRFDFKTPMETLPNKFMIEFQLKDFNTKKKMETTVLKGTMNVNQFRILLEDMKVVDMKTNGSSEVVGHFVMEPFFSRHNPPQVANSIFDYVDSCHLSYNSFIRSLERNPRLGQGYRRHARSQQSNDDESVVSNRYKQSQEVANNFRWNFRPSWFSCDSLVNMYEVRCDNIMKSDFLVDVVVTLGAEVVPGTKVVSVGGLHGISFVIPRGILPHQRIVVKVPLRLLLEKRIETLSEDKV